MIRAKRNPKGTPRDRRTWRVDKETLRMFDRYCKSRKKPSSEVIEDMINSYIRRAYPLVI